MNKFKTGQMVMTNDKCIVQRHGVITKVNKISMAGEEIYNYQINNSNSFFDTIAECWLIQI